MRPLAVVEDAEAIEGALRGRQMGLGGRTVPAFSVRCIRVDDAAIELTALRATAHGRVSHEEGSMLHALYRSTCGRRGIVVALSLALAGCLAATPERRIDNVPMYGQPQIERPGFLKKADEAFIAAAVAGVGSREKASVVWALEADRYMTEGNLDFAMRRYNQAWLLNPQNYHPYWGFGRVLLQRGRIDEAIEHYKKAKQLIDDAYQKPALLTDTGTADVLKASSLSETAVQERQRYFALADEHFSQSVALDPEFAFVYRQWAQSLYRQGDYAGAWEKVKQARLKNAPAFASGFLQALEQRMPEPR